MKKGCCISRVGLTMFVGVLGWRCSNKADYIGEEKVFGSTHGRCLAFHFDLCDILRMWPV